MLEVEWGEHTTKKDGKTMKSDKIIEEILFEIEKHEGGMSRRNAMKLLAASPIAASVLASATTATEAHAASSNATGKIVIVGGGLAGVATAAKLTSRLSNPNITLIEPNPKSVSYQPGQTLIAAGVWQKSDIEYETANFMPKGVKWIKDSVVSFDPQNNKVKTSDGTEISYDYLVVATGLTLNFAAIKGLDYSHYDANVVNGKVLHINDFEEAYERLTTMDLNEAERYTGTNRRDLVIVGILIVKAIMRKLGFETCIVIDDGLREGVVLEQCYNLYKS